jgi:hypothetical protein
MGEMIRRHLANGVELRLPARRPKHLNVPLRSTPTDLQLSDYGTLIFPHTMTLCCQPVPELHRQCSSAFHSDSLLRPLLDAIARATIQSSYSVWSDENFSIVADPCRPCCHMRVIKR